MGTRGRKSKNDLQVVNTIDRAGPPAALTDEQTFEWLRITNDEPADYFTAAQLPLLEQYVKHRVEARHIAELIRMATEGDKIDIKSYDKLLSMQERESRTMASLGVRLGFAKTTAANSVKSTRKPWE